MIPKNQIVSIEIKYATHADAHELLDLRRRLIQYDSQFDPTLDCNPANSQPALIMHSIQNNIVLTAKIDNKIIGYLIACHGEIDKDRINAQSLQLEEIYIVKEHRSHGIGELLIKKFKSIAQKQNIKRLTVKVSPENLKAINFYKRHSFTFEYALILECTTTELT